MKRRNLIAVLSAALALVLMLTLISGCGKKDDAAKPASSTEPTASAEPSDTETAAERKDGERFEETITIEGMEETVKYEHIRKEAAGFAMDYDYERFERQSGADYERFVSVYDDPDTAENYLEVRYNPQDAEAVAEAIDAALSNAYTTGRDDSFELERAGKCIRIDASETKSGGEMPDQLEMVYIIPADDGCRVATAHYAIEGAEGFGRRFAYMMHTLAVLPVQGEGRISDETALSAVKRYGFAGNPDLAEIANAGQYPVYWEVVSSDDAEIVVLFRSYTGAQVKYHIDPVSGETYVTEFVPGITAEEQRTDESFNIWNYAF